MAAEKVHKRNKSDKKDKPYKKKYKVATEEDSVHELDSYVDIEMPNKGRNYSISMAVPSSILESTVLKDEFRVYIVAQLAKSAAIFGVDQFIIYNDNCWKSNFSSKHDELTDLMKTVLEYQECPQYLRKRLCPVSDHLTHAGLMNPIGAPHHLKADEWCKYREGVVMRKNGKEGYMVDVGIGRNVSVKGKDLKDNTRVTVKLPTASRVLKSPVGEVVARDKPRTKHGLYWGYTVRVAKSLSEVLTGDGDETAEGYDLMIGTSDKGISMEDVKLPNNFKKVLIVFGGVQGLEEALKRDRQLEAQRPAELFRAYVNACPHQCTRTIRTEEAVPLALAKIVPALAAMKS